MPTAPLQVSHPSGLQPPLSQTCQRCHDQPTDADAADQLNHWLQALRLIQVTITFLLAVRPCVTCGKHCVTLCHLFQTLSVVTHVSLMSHFAFHVSDVSHITWCHTLQTTRFHVAPDSHSNTCVGLVSHLCHTCATLVSHWLAMLYIWLVRPLSCGSNLSRVLVTILILSVKFRSFLFNFDPFGQILILLV